jgi:hypothetical protein
MNKRKAAEDAMTLDAPFVFCGNCGIGYRLMDTIEESWCRECGGGRGMDPQLKAAQRVRARILKRPRASKGRK